MLILYNFFLKKLTYLLYKFVTGFIRMKNWTVIVTDIDGTKKTFFSLKNKREDAINDVLVKIEDNELMNDIEFVESIQSR